MNVAALLQEFDRRGVRLRVEAGCIIAKPLSAVPSDLRKDAAEHKDELIEAIHADEALHLLNRFKTYTLPTGRMRAAREIADRCAARLFRWEQGEPVFEIDDSATILTVLREIERELISLGGAPDRELLEAVDKVQAVFPSSRLVDLRRKKPEQ